MVKVNPIVAWSDEQIDNYIAEHGVLVNPLLSEGYGSVGCAPCTRRALGRSGRWAEPEQDRVRAARLTPCGSTSDAGRDCHV